MYALAPLKPRRHLPTLRAPLVLGLAVLATGGCGGEKTKAVPAPPPDVVLVAIESLRADALSVYGNELPTVPWIGGLAEEGAVFEDVTAQSTLPLVSTASLFQGRYPREGADEPDAAYPTLAERFREAGYHTVGFIGSFHIKRESGFARGFDHFDARSVDDRLTLPVGKRRVDELAYNLRAWIKTFLGEVQAEGGKRPPLFLYLHLMDVGTPFDAYPQYDHFIPQAAPGEPMPWPWQREAYEAEGPRPPDFDPGWAKRWEVVNAERGRYHQGVRYTDEGLEELFEKLGETGVLDNALVAFVGTHGEGLWERRAPYADRARYAKLMPTEFFMRLHLERVNQELVSTPLILWGAPVPAGRRIATPVANVDLAPTLLELCGLPISAGVEGRSLVPLLEGDDLEAGPILSTCKNAVAVRDPAGGLKLILPKPGVELVGIEPELFDLRSDPGERVNLHDERPDDVRRLTELLAGWE